MDNGPMSLEEFCRRQWLNRKAAITEHVERRTTLLSQAAGPQSSGEKVQSESSKRVLRARSVGSSER